MRVLSLCVVVVALWGCTKVPLQSSVAENVYDGGGVVDPYYALANYARETKTRIEIRGTCASACALKLSSGENLCVSRLARIGVHEVRFSGPQGYEKGERSDEGTEAFRKFLPPCAEKLFSARRGFDTGEVTFVNGADILDACPDIKPCR